jgi:hypothetical protein
MAAHESALPAALAADARLDSRLFTLWYAATTVFVLAILVFSAVCGIASTCMSWVTVSVVLMPVIRPSTLAMRLIPPSIGAGVERAAGDVAGRPSHRLSTFLPE